IERRRYEELFEFAPDAYLETDRHGVIKSANRAAAEMLSIDSGFLVPKPLSLFIGPEQKRAFLAFLAGLAGEAGDGWVREWEAPMKPRNSPHFRAWLRVAPVRDFRGELTALRWVIRDVTERKEQELRIQQMNVTLEKRVKDRTADLQKAQEVLLGSNRL